VHDLLREREQRHSDKLRRRARNDATIDPRFVFFHLGKNGGGSVRQYLRPIRRTWVGAGHDASLDSIAARWPGVPVSFFVRHPVSRFVSGYNNFRRAVIQNGTKRATNDDIIARSWFHTPNDLAEALASDDERTLSAAHYAMSNLGFLSNPLTDNLHSPEVVDAYAGTIAFIGLFENFNTSVEGLRRTFDLPVELAIPTGDTAAHRSPRRLSTRLSAVGQAAVLDWYRADLVLYEHCREIHLQQMEKLGL